MQLVKTVRRLLVDGVAVLVGTEVPQGAAHLLMGVIEALHGEVGEIAVPRRDRTEADLLIIAHMPDLDVEVIRRVEQSGSKPSVGEERGSLEYIRWLKYRLLNRS